MPSLYTCSFCGGETHNIRSCRSPLIRIHYTNLRTIYNNYRTNLADQVEARRRFIGYISRRYNLRDLKVVSIHYTPAFANLTKQAYATEMWEHFAQLELREQYLHHVGARTPSGSPPSPDDFVAFVQNLDAIFAATTKKFYISPVLWVFETDKELANEFECAICYENKKLVDTVTLNCGHQFCGPCIMNTCKTQPAHKTPCCALCRTEINTFVVKDEETFGMVEQYCII